MSLMADTCVPCEGTHRVVPNQAVLVRLVWRDCNYCLRHRHHPPRDRGRNGAPGDTGAAAERWPRRSCSPSAPGAGGETSGRCQLKSAELPAVHGEIACCATCDPVKLLVMLLRKRQWAMTSCRCLCWGPTSGSRQPSRLLQMGPHCSLLTPESTPRVPQTQKRPQVLLRGSCRSARRRTMP